MEKQLNFNTNKFRICVDADNVSIIKNVDNSINVTIDIDKEEIKNILDEISISKIITNNGTGLPAESIDIVLLFNVIFMIEDKESVIDELHRILKKGGIISIVNNGLGSKFKNKQVSKDSLIKSICKSKKFSFSEKIGNNYNFVKNIKENGIDSFVKMKS